MEILHSFSYRIWVWTAKSTISHGTVVINKPDSSPDLNFRIAVKCCEKEDDET